jgi:hypothetical protein
VSTYLREIAHCPECDTKITLAKQRRRCPRCKHVFKHSSTAVTADGPAAPLLDLEGSALPEQPIHIPAPGPLRGVGRALLAQLVIAVSVALALYPIAYHAYDRSLQRWIGPEMHFDHRIELRPRQGDPDPKLGEFCAIAILMAFAGLGLWHGVACQNAELLANGLKWPQFSVIAVLLFPLVSGMLFCVAGAERTVLPVLLGVPTMIIPCMKLDEIWRASDPKTLLSPEAWKERNPSWLVGAWGISLFTASGFLMLAIVVGDFTFPAWAANVNVAITGILTTTIIRATMKRQQERYRRLYGKVPTQ